MKRVRHERTVAPWCAERPESQEPEGAENRLSFVRPAENFLPLYSIRRRKGEWWIPKEGREKKLCVKFVNFSIPLYANGKFYIKIDEKIGPVVLAEKGL